MSALTGKQKRHLRALGHHLRPVAHVGNNGLSQAVLDHVDGALEDHELIKVKVGDGSSEGARDLAGALAEGTRSEIAQIIGHVVLLYRAREEDPEIVLPR